MMTMNKQNAGMLFVISGPSASGKDTIISKVSEIIGSNVRISISMTTRAPRGQEQEGVNYYYVSEEEFLKNIETGNMLEYAKYGDYYYGTPLAPVKKWLDEGRIVFLVIEVQGGEKIRSIFPDSRKVFIIPPSLVELEKRLRGRGTETEEAITKRLTIARGEIMRAVEYDYIVENDVLDNAVNDVLSIIRAEQLLTENMKRKIREVIDNA